MHSLNDYTRQSLLENLEDEADEFGVTVHQMIFNEKEDFLHCICEAPSKDAVIKHHMKFNTKCDHIVDIDQIKTDKIIKDEKLKTLGELSARISHDLRNPLSTIQASLDLIRIKHPNLYETEKSKFDLIDRSINRILHQTTHVLGYLKSHKPNISENNIEDILNSVFEEITIPIEVTVQKNLKDEKIKCDFELMRIVFSNIILNALQAVNNYGEISINSYSDSDNYNIEFVNSGPPISGNLLSKIFEPLYTTKQEGTGLGLTASKNIVELHKGKIFVRNNPTTFKIIIPKNIME